MGRFCYCSKLLPGQSNFARDHWKNKAATTTPEMKAAEMNCWSHLKMTSFESWLQKTPQGDFLIHCLEGESLQQIFKGLREKIASCQGFALRLQHFYQTVLGKNYALPETEPHIEPLLDISLPPLSEGVMKRGFFFPLLPHKEEAHRRFRQEASTSQRGRHEASMRAFGVTRLSTWLHHAPEGKRIVVYTERCLSTPHTSSERLHVGESSPEWQGIAATLMDHTGLSYEGLSPDVEWLTAP